MTREDFGSSGLGLQTFPRGSIDQNRPELLDRGEPQVRESNGAGRSSDVGSANKSVNDGGEMGLPETRPGRRGSLILDLAELRKCKEMLLTIERRIADNSIHEDDKSATGKLTSTESRNNQSLAFTDEYSIALQTTPSLCERPWSDFMNKRWSDQPEHAIEILVGDPDYHPRRGSKRSNRKREKAHDKSTSTDFKRPDSGSQAHPEQDSVPNRIRINSLFILAFLKGLDESIDETTPLVMLHPYKFLIHHETGIGEYMTHLRQQLGELPGALVGSTIRESNATSSGTSSPDLNTESRHQALQHMQILETFVNRYIKPTLCRLATNSNIKVHFTDLWYLFQPGDDIHMPLKAGDTSISAEIMGITPETFQSRYNTLWRITSVSGGRSNIQDAQNRNVDTRPNNFKVDCYYIDFHGRFFRPTVHTFEIAPFEGEINVTQLDFYPERFLEAVPEQKNLNNNIEKGTVVYKAMAHSFTHFFYSGPTLMVHPCGCAMADGPSIQEHIESEVIVDFKMALRKHPAWMPQRERWKEPVTQPEEVTENAKVSYWLDEKRKSLKRTEVDQVYDDYVIDRERAMAFSNREVIFAPIPSGWLSNESMVPEKDIKLLPGRVYAFVLRTRTFMPLWLSALKPIEAKLDGINSLQLKDNSFKDTLQALVKTHFMQSTSENGGSFEYDIVRGKGRGLVILLHGAPGLGKTFTAESVAAANGQPLLQITCGDLGLDPKEVDAALKEIFYWASYWRCVLLLDECDIFLGQRNKNDVKRNALVSVFLRVLEFYTGVLFLTTNRVGALDEAIKSRITWISYYPPLSLDQTKAIWKTNIKRVEKSLPALKADEKSILKFAKRQYSESTKPGMPKSEIWNGRKIQNAFKVATALAYWESCSSEERGQTELLATSRRYVVLTASHFEEYARDTRAFDAYVREAMGFDESARAFNSLERNDDWDEEDYEFEQQATSLSPVSPREPRRRTSASSMQRPLSPIQRPHIAARQSTTQLLDHFQSPVVSREPATNALAGPARRRSNVSALNATSAPGFRLTNEHRHSVEIDTNHPAYHVYGRSVDYYAASGPPESPQGQEPPSSSDEEGVN